ncbi:hypothetical protein C8F04DRAFT_1294052 [Mycena alexandri]|uniref:Uncharacterized protein n=1 Tax=Mycena alexandri TaxID=1745969 RepID=A0AAD6SL81_9AGAR|nr:hypothetical protein C8F04DRAFT_1294052 [Mycena alexandri]
MFVQPAAQNATVLAPFSVTRLVRLQDLAPSPALRTSSACALPLMALRVLAVPMPPPSWRSSSSPRRRRPCAHQSHPPPLSLQLPSSHRPLPPFHDRVAIARLRRPRMHPDAEGVCHNAVGVVALVGMGMVGAEVWVIEGQRLGFWQGRRWSLWRLRDKRSF